MKEAESGLAVNEGCRKHGISSATYYKWKSKYGGLEVSELKRIKELEAEGREGGVNLFYLNSTSEYSVRGLPRPNIENISVTTNKPEPSLS